MATLFEYPIPKLIVAIHLGATQSMYSYSYGESGVFVNPQWGSEVGLNSNTTVNSVRFDRIKQCVAFGYNAEDESTCSISEKDELYRFNMSLLAQSNFNMDTKLTSVSGNTMDALDVVSTFINCMKDKFESHLMGTPFSDLKDEQVWVLSIPCITRSANKFMRKAAYQAKLIDSINSDKVVIADRTESMRVFFLEKKLKLNTYGMHMIIDCSDHDLYVSVHRQTDDGNVEVLVRTICGAWGLKEVNRRVETIFRECFGNEIIDDFLRIHISSNFDLAEQMPVYRSDISYKVDLPFNEIVAKCDISIFNKASESYEFKNGKMIIKNFDSYFKDTIDAIRTSIKNLIKTLDSNDFFISVLFIGVGSMYLKEAIGDIFPQGVQHFANSSYTTLDLEVVGTHLFAKDPYQINYMEGPISLHDAAFNTFTNEEISVMVRKSAPCIILAGESNSGKSSLAGSMMKRRSYLNPYSDRTILINYLNIALENNKVAPLFDLGGHEIYKHVWPLFNRNHPNVTNLITHEIKKTQELHEDTKLHEYTEKMPCLSWISESIEFAPKAQLILVITKSDELTEHRELKIKNFKKAAEKWTEKKIKLFDKKIKKLRESAHDTEHSEKVCKKYENFKQEMSNMECGSMMCVTSCKDFRSIEDLLQKIQKNCLQNENPITTFACKLYDLIGKIGLKKNIEMESITHNDISKDEYSNVISNPDLHGDSNPCLRDDSKHGLHDDSNPSLHVDSNPGLHDDSNPGLHDDSNPGLHDDSKHDLALIETDGMESRRVLQRSITSSPKILYIKLKDLDDELRKNTESSLEETGLLKKRLIEALKQLHDRGLIFYFYSEPQLSEIVFNDIPNLLNILRLILNHNNEKIFVNIDESLKGSGKEQMNQDKFGHFKNLLETSGIMKHLLLKNIAIKLAIDTLTLQKVLVYLNIGYPAPSQNCECDMFIPFYVKNEKRVSQIKPNLEMFYLRTQYKGTFPESINYLLSISVYRNMITHNADTMELAGNGLSAVINDTRLDIIVSSYTSTIDIFMRCPLEGHRIKELWKNWESCKKAMDELELWWPEMFTDKSVICTHCILKESAYVKHIPVEYVLTSNAIEVHCDDDKIPAALIYPLDETNAEPQCRKLSSWLKGSKVKVNKAKHPNVTNNRTYEYDCCVIYDDTDPMCKEYLDELEKKCDEAELNIYRHWNHELGEEMVTTFIKNVEKSKFVIIIFNEGFEEQQWNIYCTNHVIVEKFKNFNQFHVIPIVFPGGEKPKQLMTIHHLDVEYDWKTDETNWSKLMAAISEK